MTASGDGPQQAKPTAGCRGEIAILLDHAAVGRLVLIVVAAEAARRVHVAEVVLVRSPGHLHRREDVAADRAAARHDGVVDVGAVRGDERRVVLAVEAAQRRGDLRSPPSSGRDIRPSARATVSRRTNGSVARDLAARERAVDGAFGRRRERMAGTVVAVHAVHPPPLPLAS